jgi:hypothetical protein
MITCNLMGGLGNQLFQIFTTISYGIDSYNKFIFLNLKTLGGGSSTERKTYWESIMSRLKFCLVDELPNLPIKVIRENNFTFNDLPISDMTGNNIMLFGYFQSYKYFEKNYNLISRIIRIDNFKTELLLKLNYNDDYFKNTISIHFRIGDYKKIQQYHPVMTKEYYEKCLNYILSIKKDSREIYNILYFCEDDDIEDVQNTIEYLSEKFPLYNFIRGDNTLEDWEQMLLMSCCHHNIIANSSFSWWSAYFNEWSDKIVCYPSVWFGPSAPHDTKDLCPPSWKCIEANQN